MAVVMWTALPALACIMPASQPACCRGMMHGCEASSGMDEMPCCQARTSEHAVPPVATAPSHFSLNLTHAAAWLTCVPDAAAIHSRALATAISPSPPQSSLSSILRI
jgi:hypothetical protein